jgi:hypothetical protein
MGSGFLEVTTPSFGVKLHRTTGFRGFFGVSATVGVFDFNGSVAIGSAAVGFFSDFLPLGITGSLLTGVFGNLPKHGYDHHNSPKHIITSVND